MKEGRILRGVGGAYWIETLAGEICAAKPRGIFRKQKQVPLPGDWGGLGDSGDDDFPYVIENISPRQNSLIRPSLANLDLCFLTFAVADPEPDLLLLDKLACIASLMSIIPVIIWTKADLAPEKTQELQSVYRATGWQQLISQQEQLPVSCMRQMMQGKIACLAGPSGVGKSTLTNALLEAACMETGEISEKLGRGRHTTRHVELFRLKSEAMSPDEGLLSSEQENAAISYLADTPGFTSLELEQLGIYPEELIKGYPDLSVDQSCRFLDCRHLNEPECAVRERAQEDPGLLERYQRYRQLRESLENVPVFTLRQMRKRLPKPGLPDHALV